MRALLRFLLDAFYVLGFAAITTAGVIGVLELALKGIGVDDFILILFHWVGRIIAVADGLGIICGSGFSLYRFIDALREDARRPAQDSEEVG